MEVLNLLTTNLFLQNSSKNLQKSSIMSPKILKNPPKIKFFISLHVNRNSIRSEPCYSAVFSPLEQLEILFLGHGISSKLLRRHLPWSSWYPPFPLPLSPLCRGGGGENKRLYLGPQVQKGRVGSNHNVRVRSVWPIQCPWFSKYKSSQYSCLL